MTTFTHLIDTERLLHSFKTALACIIGFIVTKALQLPADQWVVVTILVVMCAQIYVGSVMQKAYLRFLGTALGCAFASIVIVSFGTSNITLTVGVGIATLLFSYIATSQENMSYAGVLGAVTTVIIFIGQEPTLLVVLQRCIEISIGIIIATIVSQFFIPINAKTHLRRQQADTLEQIHNFYISTMIKHDIKSDADYQNIDENIVKSLSKQRQLAVESAHEPLGEKFNAKRFIDTLYAERNIIRSITFMHSAYKKIPNAAAVLDTLKETRSFHQAVENNLSILVRALERKPISPISIHLPDMASLKQAFYQLPFAEHTDNAMYLNSYLYAAEMLVDSLQKIAVIYKVETFI